MNNQQFTLALIALIALNVPLYYWLAKRFFRDMADFGECVFFWLKPDILSWVDGSLWDDIMGSLRLFGWITLCIIITMLEVVFLLPLVQMVLGGGGGG